jgi:hypothetical protein
MLRAGIAALVAVDVTEIPRLPRKDREAAASAVHFLARGNIAVFIDWQLARVLAARNDRGSDGQLVRLNIHRGLPLRKSDQHSVSQAVFERVETRVNYAHG